MLDSFELNESLFWIFFNLYFLEVCKILLVYHSFLLTLLIIWAVSFFGEIKTRNSRVSDLITFDSFLSVLNSGNFFLYCLLTNNIISCYSLQSMQYASWFLDLVFLTFSFQANFIVFYLCLATWSVFWIYTSPFSAQGHQSIQELGILAFFTL